MTVAGRGGRPRKWTSQADRQRAWRNRQTGVPEPATFIEALDRGDELAAAVAHGEDLARQLQAAKEKAARLQTELNRERRDRGVEDRRWGWITTMNEELTATNHRLRAELDEAHDDNRHLERRVRDLETRTRPAPLAVPAPPAAPPAPSLGRAERRRLEREQRRRNP